MKRIFLCIILIICISAGIYSFHRLPGDTTQLVEEKYDSVSGVLRIWVSEDTGSTAWINKQASAFEKDHKGLYLHINEVPLTAIENYDTSGIRKPDIIVYPSSAAVNESGLASITSAYPVRSGITHYICAIPILLYPRFWIYDASVMDSLPGDMYDTPAACSAEDLNSLVALSAGRRSTAISEEGSYGIDIGLIDDTRHTTTQQGVVSCQVGPLLTVSDDPQGMFRDRKAHVFIGTASDVLLLEDKYNIAAAVTGSHTYTAEALMYSIVRSDEQRTGICREFLDHIMEEGQADAALAQAFPAVTGVGAWSSSYILSRTEAALEERTWILGRSGNSIHAQLYIEEKITADEALEQIIRAEEQD